MHMPTVQEDTLETTRARGKSLRTRPSQLLENYNAEPLSPLKDPELHHPLQQRASKMSLFSLFNRPKVEKARGYAEPGLTLLSPQDASAPRSDLLAQTGSNDAPSDRPLRAQSSMSFRNATKSVSSKAKAKVAAAQQAQATLKAGPWEPPPLFQAYPQSTKHGALEASTMTAEAVLQKSRSRKNGGLHSPNTEAFPRESAEGNGSADTRRNARSTMWHASNGSAAHVELPKKIFILITSGYLLQYADSGPSNRLPERVLELGKDSAAYVCDLVPGKHYVLQVSQAVDQQGVTIANPASIFSRLGFGARSAAAKRMTDNFLLVMPNAAEMNSWMVAIREEIQTLGGKQARPDTANRPKTRSPMDSFGELKKVPSRSHRYQAKRDPSKVSLISKPSAEVLNNISQQSRTKDDDESSETGTIEGIEQEAEQLAEEARLSPLKAHFEPDAQSVSSSIANSEQQRRLGSLRSSQRNSHATSATTVATSRSNSLSGSPQSAQSLKGSDTSKDSLQTRLSYRTLSSYAVGRRRSAMPLTSARDKPLPAINVSAQVQRHSTCTADAESPVRGRDSALPVHPTSPRKLSVAGSEPNLRLLAAETNRARHDSRMPSPPFLSTEELDRPVSVVGDLPSPSTLAGERLPNRRLSLFHAATAQANAQRTGIRAAERTSEPVRPVRRHSTQPFNLPLKINPSTPANRPPTREETDSSFNTVEKSAGNPVMHTLTAKIDPSHRLSVSPVTSPLSPGSPKPEVPSRNPARTPSGRLSLFPSQMAFPPPSGSAPLPYEVPRRSPSATTLSSQIPPQPNVATLRRPTSMQVRSDHAPFLRSVRNSTVGPPPASINGRSFTAPIRSLKPSRTSTNMAAESLQPSPTDPFKHGSATFESSPVLPEESIDQATPLPDAPLPTRPSSRSSGGRRTNTRSSLPELDLGMDVVGLGPPAPPPQAPLPLLPSGSRPTSPMPAMPYEYSGLGIRV